MNKSEPFDYGCECGKKCGYTFSLTHDQYLQLAILGRVVSTQHEELKTLEVIKTAKAVAGMTSIGKPKSRRSVQSSKPRNKTTYTNTDRQIGVDVW